MREPETERYEHVHQLYLDRIAEIVERNVKKGQPNTEVKINTKIETGVPQENICNLVKENDIGLIIMTT